MKNEPEQYMGNRRVRGTDNLAATIKAVRHGDGRERDVTRTLAAFAASHDEETYQAALDLMGDLAPTDQLRTVDAAIDARIRLRAANNDGEDGEKS